MTVRGRIRAWVAGHARLVAWGWWFVIVLLAMSPIVIPTQTEDESTVSGVVVIASFYLFILAMATVGAFVATRRPTNAVPWLMLFASSWYAIAAFADSYAQYSVDYGKDLPGVGLITVISSFSWLLGLGVSGTFLLLLFPDGRFQSQRWRWVARVAAGAMVMFVLGLSITPGLLEDVSAPVENPLGIPGAKAIGDAIAGIGFLVLVVCLFVSIASVVLRYRKSRGDARQQMKWLVFAAGMNVLALFASFYLEGLIGGSETAVNYSNAVVTASFAMIPIAIGIAVLKYRLYDVDIVVNKTIVFGLLAAFITAVYVAIVVGIGAVLGSSDRPNLALSITATAVVAIAFSPVKERTQSLANRLVYGHRLSPYEVLSELSRSVATAQTPSGVLEGVARVAARSVNGSSMVRLDISDDKTVEAGFVTEKADSENLGSSESFQVEHEGERLGDISIAKWATDPISQYDRSLLTDLSSQAGLALHNARLALELQARLDEISRLAEQLSDSRSRIVSAADDSRRRLERDISEGPRRDLVSIQEELGRVHEVLASDPESAADQLTSLTEHANTTLDALRELARGIYPPLLADKGMVAALEAHIRKHELRVIFEADEDLEISRYDESLETTVYFCCLELMGSADSSKSLRLRQGAESIRVEFSDGDLTETVARAIEDRAEAVGGAFNTNGAGSGVAIVIPARPLEILT